ncbi:MAG: hypothetical protein Q4G28_02690 [Neisseria sp.]|nr:hypothetical protein [Neisseria sp.]
MTQPQNPADNQLRTGASAVIFALSLLVNTLAAALFGSHALIALAAAAVALLFNALLLLALLRLFRLIDFDAAVTALVEQRCALLAVMLATAATPAALLAAWLAADTLCSPLLQLLVLAAAYLVIRKIVRQRS